MVSEIAERAAREIAAHFKQTKGQWLAKVPLNKFILHILERAIEESRGQRWIPVEEKLPSDGERVLVWFREYPVSGVPQYRVRFGEICNDHWRPEGGNGNFDRYVTHWQPLADPPKGNENV